MADDVDAAEPELATSSTEDDPDQPHVADPGDPENPVEGRRKHSGVRAAFVAGVAITAALTGLCGWQGFRAHQAHVGQQHRNLVLRTARQGALNLTTISYTEAEADVQRILDLSTGDFREDFHKRSQPFIDVVKKAQSKSQGSIVDAAIESQDGSQSQVLVALNVDTTIAGGAPQDPRAWRMRIRVQTDGDTAKVSNVEFVP